MFSELLCMHACEIKIAIMTNNNPIHEESENIIWYICGMSLIRGLLKETKCHYPEEDGKSHLWSYFSAKIMNQNKTLIKNNIRGTECER